jgi:hypothetical protein
MRKFIFPSFVPAGSNRKCIFVLLLLVLNSVRGFSQHDLGFTLAGGLSHISNSYVPYSDTSLDYHYNRAFQVSNGFTDHGGIMYNFSFGEHSALGTEILFVQLRSKEYYVVNFFRNIDSTLVTISYKDIKRSIPSLGIPLFYRLTFEKFRVSLGMQVLFQFLGQTKTSELQNNYWNGNWETHIVEDKKDFSVLHDFGSRVGLGYDVGERFTMECSYYAGFLNINSRFNDGTAAYTWDPELGKMRSQQVTLGLSYSLYEVEKQYHSKKKKKKKHRRHW